MISCFEFTAVNYSTKVSFVFKLVIFMSDKMDGKVNKIVGTSSYKCQINLRTITVNLRQIIVRNFTIIHSD